LSDGLNIPDRIYLLQRKLNMTHADMACATGIPANSFCKLYTGRIHSLKISQLLSLCTFAVGHGVSLDWLIFGHGRLTIRGGANQIAPRDIAETCHVNSSKPEACQQENRTDATDMDVHPGDDDAAE